MYSQGVGAVGKGHDKLFAGRLCLSHFPQDIRNEYDVGVNIFKIEIA